MTTTLERRYERRRTAAEWASTNPVLASGEWGYDSTNKIAKIGDGTTAWNSLPTNTITTPPQPLDPTLTALAGANWAPDALPIGTGADTLSQTTFAANTFPAKGSTGALVAKAITDAGLAWAAAADVAAETALLNVATTALKGLQSAVDKLKEDNIWVDVTSWSTTVADNIGTARTGAQNVTAWNTVYAAAPLGTTFYFPPGTYDFNGELACNRDIRMKVKGAGLGRSILNNTSTTANLFNQSVAGFYIDFEDLGFKSTVTKTAGAAILASANNAALNFRRCEFVNQFRSIDLTGASSPGNLGGIFECLFNTPSSTAGGSQVRIDGPNVNMMIQNCTINVTGQDVIGLEVKQSGAVQVSTCDFIGGRNTLLVNATATVSALYFTNVFFDQATLGSTVKFMGTAATSRVKFTTCGITNGANGTTACEIAGTGSGTGIPEAIDFLQCDFYNNGFTGTTTGLLVTGCRGLNLRACRISGFTNGVNLTAYSANGVTNFDISDCTIGPTENFAGNGTGVLINLGAGSVTYGPSTVSNCDLSGNTTSPLTDNGTYTNNLLTVTDNLGLATAPKAESVATAVPLTTPVTRAGLGWAFPANTLRVGTRLRITVGLTCAATAQTLTPTLKMGTANTNADGDLWTSAAFVSAGTAALGSMTCVYDIHILSATTVLATGGFINGAAGITGITQQPFTGRGSAGPITVASIVSTAFFIAPYFVSATASAVTIRSVAYEVVAQ